MVESRGVDLTAITALQTLRGRLGYSEVLSVLERADIWGFSCEEGQRDPRNLAKVLVTETSIFVNPNKHRWQSWVEGEGEAGVAAGGPWILVWEAEGAEGRGALSEMIRSGVVTGVRSVSKATLWRLGLTEAAKGRELELAEEIAATYRRDRGLLANPHMHKWACGDEPLYLDMALGHLDLKR